MTFRAKRPYHRANVLSLSIHIYRMLGEQITRECRSNSHIFYREKSIPDSPTLIFPLPLYSKKNKKRREKKVIGGRDKRNRDKKEGKKRKKKNGTTNISINQ